MSPLSHFVGEGWGEGRVQNRIHHRQSTINARELRQSQADAEKVI